MTSDESHRPDDVDHQVSYESADVSGGERGVSSNAGYTPPGRAAEIARVEELRAVSFEPESQEWEAFAGALIGYAYPILVAWGVTGVLRRRMVELGVLGCTKVPEGLKLTPDDAHALACEVLIRAVETFRKTALPKWDPDGGASLKTYFVGCCLQNLPRGYVASRSPGSEISRDPHLIDDLVNQDEGSVDPAESVVPRLYAAQRMAVLEAELAKDPILKELVEHRRQGLTIEQAAEAIGTSPTSLNARLYRFRKKHPEAGGTSDG